MEKFKQLGLTQITLDALEAKGFTEPTEIQALTIPCLLENKKDIIAQAQTGTGKTAAFGLPLIERISPDAQGVQAIILAPTRELVVQVCEELNSLKGKNKLSIAAIYGGQPMDAQLRRLKQGVAIVVGTPGRVLDHMKRKSLKLETTQYFVLDEADEMLNMGFLEDIETILQSTQEGRRVLLFSATMPDRIRRLAEKYLGEYELIKTEIRQTSSQTTQIFYEMMRHDKFEALSRILDMQTDFYGMVFCRTRADVDELAMRLSERGYAADGLHGDMSQSLREKILNKFRNQNLNVLVATDVAARGIDVNNLTHVVNYSIPQNPEAYVHRIGRTGRAGKEGIAVTFVTPAEFGSLSFIKRVAKADINKAVLPDAQQIITSKKVKITDAINKMVAESDVDGFRKWANRLIGEGEPEDVVAALLKHAFGKDLDERNYRDLTPLRKRSFSDGGGRGAQRGGDRRGGGGYRGGHGGGQGGHGRDRDGKKSYGGKSKSGGYGKRPFNRGPKPTA